jgi:hypothetical protein
MSENESSKFLWFTDTHLLFLWPILKLIIQINREKPKGIFLTGDISNGLMTCHYLWILAKCIRCPIYFVLGNHDLHFCNIKKQHDSIRDLCKKHSNLIWLNDVEKINIGNDTALIGNDGWYDVVNGKPLYLRFTLDWFLVEDFRKMSSMEERIEAWKEMAKQSAIDLISKLEVCIKQGHKNIYMLTHMPPWAAATNNLNTLFDWFWLPYNTNFNLGLAIEDLLKDHQDVNLTVLAGHSHYPKHIKITNNIECRIGEANLLQILHSQSIII